MLLLEVQEEGDDLRLHGDIKRRGCLIADEDVGMDGHCTRNGRTLALAAAHLVRIAICIGGGQSDLREEFCNARLRCTFVGCAKPADGLANHCTNGAARVERAGGILKYHLDARVEGTPLLSACARDVPAIEEDVPICWHIQSREDLCNGGFAAAAFADNAEKLAPREGKGNVVERLNPSLYIVEVHGNVFKAQEGRCSIAAAYALTFPCDGGGNLGGGEKVLRMIAAVTVRMIRCIHFRYCGNQALRVWMLRISEYLVHGALLDNLSFAHDSDAVGNVPHDTDVVRDEEDCRACPLLECMQFVKYLQLDRCVECRQAGAAGAG